MVYVGETSVVGFGYESTFKTKATSIDKIFGQGTRITTINIKNNVERIYNIGARVAQQLAALRFEGSWSVEAYLSNNDWMKLALGKETEITNTAGTVTGYTYEVGNDVISATIEIGMTSGGSNLVRDLLGAIVRRWTLDCRVNEIVTVRLDGAYATESVSTPTALPSYTLDYGNVMTFVDGSVQLPTGTTVAKVQEISLDVDTGATNIFSIGDRTAVDKYGRNYEISGKMSVVAEDPTMLEYALGVGASGATSPASGVTEITAEIKFDNGTNSCIIDLSGLSIEGISNRLEANEIVIWDVDFVARDIKITWNL